MAELNTEYFARCIATLQAAQAGLVEHADNATLYDIYRAASVKEFEIILEQSGKLLKKALKPYFSTSKQVDKLTFKDVFRYAAKFDLMSLEAAERWLVYRDNRNDTAHDYGEGFAEETLQLLAQFIADAQQLNLMLNRQP
jgi:nucleotidyltransferase substrate binding protein (TIGR01987 family)